MPKPYTVTAGTDHGVVFLSGELMSQDAIASLSSSIANVDGVKAVNVRGLDAPFITISY